MPRPTDTKIQSFSPREAASELKTHLSRLTRDRSLAYLSITSKPELLIRDKIAWAFHRKFSDHIIAREHTIRSDKSPKRRKKVDLAVLDRNATPRLLMEVKAMISPDPVADAKHKLMRDLSDDLRRLTKITKTPSLGLMLMVHVDDIDLLDGRASDAGVVKYLRQFKRYTPDRGSLDTAIKRTREYFAREQLRSSHLETKLGPVWGVKVSLVSFLLTSSGDES